jgi:hypothetical protein
MDETSSSLPSDSENQISHSEVSDPRFMGKAAKRAVAIIAAGSVIGGALADMEINKSNHHQPEIAVNVWSPTEIWNGAEVFPAGTVLVDGKLNNVEKIPEGMVGFVQRPEIIREMDQPNSFARVRLGRKSFLIDLSVHRDSYKAFAYKSTNPDINHSLSWRIPARTNGHGRIQTKDSQLPSDELATIKIVPENSVEQEINQAGLVPTEHGYPY